MNNAGLHTGDQQTGIYRLPIRSVLISTSDDSSYINAIELMIDGGATGAPFGAPIFPG